MMAPYTVYALRERGSMLVRYIGVSGYARHRFLQHKRISASMSAPTAMAKWLNSCDVELVELGEYAGSEAGHAAERAAIRAFAALGHPLFNHRHVPAEKRLACRPAEHTATAA